jgi:hypothetical protein
MNKAETPTPGPIFQTDETLWSLKEVEGFRISARDGEVGKVRDFFFDDESWGVRYLVVDTGHWLPGRKVLLPTAMLIKPDVSKHSFQVSLTREQVKHSPDIDTDMPVSRLREIELHAHYDWPFYWGGVGAWLGPVPPVPPIEPPPAFTEDAGNVHLRSARELVGYAVQATDGEIGHVEDFIADDQTWAVRYLVCRVDQCVPARKVVVAPQFIAGPISWSDQTVKLRLSQAGIRNLPEYTVPVGAPSGG